MRIITTSEHRERCPGRARQAIGFQACSIEREDGGSRSLVAGGKTMGLTPARRMPLNSISEERGAGGVTAYL
ncbi:MAG: hypothetical protein AAFY60_00185 [Myxococcota bacterium]